MPPTKDNNWQYDASSDGYDLEATVGASEGGSTTTVACGSARRMWT